MEGFGEVLTYLQHSFDDDMTLMMDDGIVEFGIEVVMTPLINHIRVVCTYLMN